MLFNLKKIILLSVLVLSISLNVKTLASDNVLQAIQISGVNDSYNIVLKSDDVAEIRKTVQAPNKMMILLKGIRASKTINTIYTNTATVDSVVVEPVDDETVKILIQAANVANSQIHFDSLKTPLGVLSSENKQAPKASKSKEILLSAPVDTYRPVYEREHNDNEIDVFASGSESFSYLVKKILDSDKTSWLTTLGLFILLVVSGANALKRKDNNIKIGLSNQNPIQKEIGLYKNLNTEMHNAMSQVGLTQARAQNSQPAVNYGLRAYRDNTRNPYTTPEIKRPYMPAKAQMPQNTVSNNRVNTTPNALQKAAQEIIKRNSTTQTATTNKITTNSVEKPVSMPASMAPQRPKTGNIDSMKFLESMTKIYEKNGRSDLAQGLKNKIKKVNANIA